jgi:Na+/glutamate symporter
MTGKNIFLALLLSLVLTFILAVIYAFYPLIPIILSNVNRENGSVGAVGGGLSARFLKALLIVEPVLFIAILAFLRWRSAKG